MSKKEEIITRLNEWNQFLEGVQIDELKKECTRDDLKELLDVLGSDKKWEVTSKIRDLEKAMKEAEYPEINGVRFYPELKEANFLSEEEKLEVDRNLARLRKGYRVYRLSAIFSREREKLEQLNAFLIEKGIVKEFHYVYHQYCGNSRLTSMVSNEDKVKLEKHWKLAKEGNIESSEWIERISEGYCDDCEEEIDITTFDELTFETLLLLEKKADHSLDNV